MRIDKALAQIDDLLNINRGLLEVNEKLIDMVRQGIRLRVAMMEEIDQLQAKLRDRGDLPSRPPPE